MEISNVEEKSGKRGTKLRILFLGFFLHISNWRDVGSSQHIWIQRRFEIESSWVVICIIEGHLQNSGKFTFLLFL